MSAEAGGRHYGVVAEGGPRGISVVHNDKDAGYVHETYYREFSGGAIVYLVSRKAQNDRERSIIALRARSLIGTKYELLNFNCEHAANYAETSEAVSPSVGKIVLLGLALFVFSGKD